MNNCVISRLPMQRYEEIKNYELRIKKNALDLAIFDLHQKKRLATIVGSQSPILSIEFFLTLNS